MSVLLRKGRPDLSDAELEVLWVDMNHDGDEAQCAGLHAGTNSSMM